MEAVEKRLAILYFLCKTCEKRENFICLLPTRRFCRSHGVVEEVIRPLLGPLPTGPLKPSEVLVTNKGDNVCEVKRRLLILSKVPTPTGRFGASAKNHRI